MGLLLGILLFLFAFFIFATVKLKSLNDKLTNDNTVLRNENIAIKDNFENQKTDILNNLAELKNKIKIASDFESYIKVKQNEKMELEDKINNYLQTMNDYQQKIDELTLNLEILVNQENIFDFGLYEYKYNFQDSADYRSKLDLIKSKQQLLTKEGKVVLIPKSVETYETKKYFYDVSKLMVRSFNAESDNMISKVRFNNVVSYEEKIVKLSESVNKFGKNFQCTISKDYVDLKLEELRLEYELQQKLYEEKEEQRLIKEQMREEEKEKREFEKALKEVQEEEKRFEKALEEAKKQLDKATDADKQGLEAKIAELMNQLESAKQKERAVSQAQLTKCGHIYIISNIGSFGEDVYKVGMTRRLEPMERVKELGDASVPFEFDVHALVYSENAPDLERKLHKFLNDHRLNKVNERREFFKVDLNRIESILRQENIKYELTKIAEAKEYRESLALLNSKNN